MRNIFLSAVTGLALALSAAACGSNGAAPGATFLPGDYVAGFAAGYEDNYVDCSGFHYDVAMETFGLLQLTVDEDGTITGTFTDYYGVPLSSLPGEDDGYGDEYEVEGTAVGTDFEAEILDHDLELSITGTISGTGVLLGKGSSGAESGLLAHAAGLETSDADTAIACGYFSLYKTEESHHGRVALISRDNELHGVFLSSEFFGILDTDLSAAACPLFTPNNCSDDAKLTGTLFGDTDVEFEPDVLEVDVNYASEMSYLYVFNTGFSNADYDGFLNAETSTAITGTIDRSCSG